MWRYGWSHPDEDLLGVIDAAGDALRAQIASARAVLSGEALAEAERINAVLEEELEQDIPELALLLGLEARINALYPPAIQRRRAWMLRERFERVAPARAVLEYWASSPPEPDGEAVLAEEIRRADAAVRAAEAAAAAAKAARDAAREALAAAAQGGRAAAEAALAEAETQAGAAESAIARAAARRDFARARAELNTAQRALCAAVAAARAAALLDTPSQQAAQTSLDAARRAHSAALDALDSREEALDALGEARGPGTANAVIDADAQTLLGYIHTSYMMSVGREKAVRDLMRWLIMRFWSANFIAAVLLLVIFLLFSGSRYANLGNLVIGLFFIAAVGRIGATMSVVQRLQRAVAGNVLSGDSLLEVTRLRTGKNGINLALFSGAVFALLLYAIFATGAPAMIGFDDGIFPEMSTPAEEARTQQAVQEVKDQQGGEAGEEGDAGNASTADTAEAGNAAAGDAAESNAAAALAGPAEEGNAVAAVDSGTADAATNETAGDKPIPPDTPDTSTPAAPEEEVGLGEWLRSWFRGAETQCKANESCDPFTQIAEALGFPDRADFFKLLLWAFLAGFAERLVPDVLDSITRRTRGRVTTAEEAAAARNRAAAAEGNGTPDPAPPSAPAAPPDGRAAGG